MMASYQFPPVPSSILSSEHHDEDKVLDYAMIKGWATLAMESTADRLERYVEYFTPSTSELIKMSHSFTHELQIGLEAHARHPRKWYPDECSFKMLDSCVETLPTGNEKGVFYALDFGGTNFRVVRTQLLGQGKVRMSQCKQSLTDATIVKNYSKGLLDPRATATNLFDFFAKSSLEFMSKEGDITDKKSDALSAGFTFSFPCSQNTLSGATLMEWTKGFETGRMTNDPVEGLNVSQLMNAGFDRHSVPLKVEAVLNDTVGTLLAGCYALDQCKPRCLIGLILGTGVNACYFEKQASDYGYRGNIVNIECGNFDRNLPFTNVDLELDFAEISNRGRQRLEKMVSGAYLGELCRRAIVKTLQNCAPKSAWIPYSFSSEHVSRIIEDTSPDLARTATIMKDVWGAEFNFFCLQAIHRLCTVIMNRSAALSAVLITGVARKTGYLQPAMMGCSVAIDGSLYKNVPFFQKQLRAHMRSILSPETAGLIHLTTADDGSGKGAAILAALTQQCA